VAFVFSIRIFGFFLQPDGLLAPRSRRRHSSLIFLTCFSKEMPKEKLAERRHQIRKPSSRFSHWWNEDLSGRTNLPFQK
jgi:hypothetical protein